jgi:[ribosomal protein S5]-alanine N-acetyltransferase
MSDPVSFLPFQNLESGRLLLRQITPADVPAIFKLRSNPETMKYVPRPVLSKLEEAEEHYKLIQDKIEKNEGINWAITLKTSPHLIGIIGHYRIKWEHFRSEIGYMILPEYHGQGIVTEAVKLIIAYGFGYMKMHSLEAIIDPANIASAKVLEKNKFVKEGHFRQNEYYNGKFLDSAIYSLLKEDYII